MLPSEMTGTSITADIRLRQNSRLYDREIITDIASAAAAGSLRKYDDQWITAMMTMIAMMMTMMTLTNFQLQSIAICDDKVLR